MSESERHLYPLLFTPVLKDYVWGGRNLERVLGRELPPGRVAESWEIAAHDDGASTVANGPYTGRTLTEVHGLLGLDLIGRRNGWAQERGKFPLLVKLLDASDKLSVQVHPNDAYALAHEGNELGKTEMWVVLHAEPGARLIIGLCRGIAPSQFRQAIESGTLEECLHTLAVKAGDFVCVPSGTVHALLDGVVIAEIQQNSNTTYRVYDWNRAAKGRARPLHIDKAMDVIDFTCVEPPLPQPTPLPAGEGLQRSLLCHNQYFTTERIEFSAGATFQGNLDGETLEIWGVLAGTMEINGVTLRATQFVLLPAALGPFHARAVDETTCLRTYVADPTWSFSGEADAHNTEKSLPAR
jgi:mannose-6-phosphate isomerase